MLEFLNFEKKFGYAELFSLIALIFAGIALYQSFLSRQDTRLISGLDLKPIIKVRSEFYKNKDNLYGVTVYNEGPVDALQIEAALISHRYSDKTNDVKVSLISTETSFFSETLKPFKKIIFPVPAHFLYGNAMIEEPRTNNILQFKITYKRPPDFKSNTESAFYYVDPDGIWVRENSNSLTDEKYRHIKKAVESTLAREPFPKLDWDKLYNIQTK